MVALAVLAGTLDHVMQHQLEEMSLTVQEALRLSLLRLLDGLEVAALTERTNRQEDEATAYQTESVNLSNQATQDEHYAEIQRNRGDYLERLSRMETAQAAMHYQWARHDDAERAALLQNITALQEDRNETLTELQQVVHEGACAWKVVSSICAAVGGATKLQERADADSLAIQNDWREANQLERQEAMQNLVAEMMTTKSHRYDQAAHDLWQIANQWEVAAQQAWNQSQHDNTTAQALWQEANREHKIIQQDKSVEYKVDVRVAKLMQQADMQRSAAYWCAVGAIVTACAAVLFFGGQVIPRGLAAVQALETSHDATDMTYVALHVLIFLLVLGLAGDYVVYLERYTTLQRAIILIWFATVASLGQTISLHALPWAVQQAMATTNREPVDVIVFVMDMATRFVILGIMSLMEILLAWLSLGHALFSPVVAGICANWFFRLLVVGLCLAYGIWVEYPRRDAQDATVDEMTTLTSAESLWPENQSIALSSSEASESTPLRKSDLVSWGTAIDLALGAGEPGDGTTASLSRTSTPLGSLYQDLSRLILPLEILFVACMMAVLRNGLRVVWISHPTWIQISVLACVMGLLAVAFWFTHEACCEKTWADSSTKSRKNDEFWGTASLRVRPKFEMVQV